MEDYNINTPSEKDNTDTSKMYENDMNTLPQTHGAVYTPNSEGGGYSCETYDGSRSSETNADNIPSNADTGKNKPSKKKGRLAAVAVAVVACILFASISAIASAYLTRRYFYSQFMSDETTEYTPDNTEPEDNQVHIDTSENPGYVTENVDPGELMSMEQAIAAVKDSVVEITTETVKSGFGGYSQYVVSGAGSGVIISTGGYIVTNHHVIEGASNIKVRLTDGTEHEAKLVGTDSKTDIAVLLIKPTEGAELSTATIGKSTSLSLGQTVIAIGNPLGELGGTVTDGIISSLAREVAIDGGGYMSLLQTNAAVSPGNSGGGLFDLYGRLIGVVNAKSTGEGIEGISFAIPIDTAWDVASQLIDKGYVSGRPSLGVTLKEMRYSAGIFGDIYTVVVVDDPKGVEGLKKDDMVISIDNMEVSTLDDISALVYNYKIGDSVTMRVRRDRRDYEVKVKIIEYVPADLN